MVRQVIWSDRAKNDRIAILKYWVIRNKSKTYPRKLNNLFEKSVRWISVKSNPSKQTDHKNVFVKIVGDYKIFYQIELDQVQIITIWDTRRNPKVLKRILSSSE